MIIDQAQPYREKVIALLVEENLPVEDLPELLAGFIVAIENETIVGVAGLEVYGEYGLLRSLAVSADYRNKGIAGKLLQRILAKATLLPLKELYLLTETAPGYFGRKGFLQITRNEVPVEVMGSSEFSHVCPVSAIVMKKILS